MCPSSRSPGTSLAVSTDDHAGQRLRGGDVDLLDQCARIFRSEHCAMQHPRDLHVVNKFACSQQLLLRSPGEPCARPLCPCLPPRSRAASIAKCLRSQLNRAFNLLVPSAAAKVVADGGLDLSGGGVGILVEQRLRADHHARHAEAALHRSYFAEGPSIDLPAHEPKCLRG